MTVYIKIDNIGSLAGPFNLYSDVDGYAIPFQTNVPKATLLAGISFYNVPNGTTTIEVISQGNCNNYFYIPVSLTTTTTTSFPL